MSLSQIKRSGEQGRGLAMAGLIIGYVLTVVTIIAVIVALVFSVIAVRYTIEELDDAMFPKSETSTATAAPTLPNPPTSGGALPAFRPPADLGANCQYPRPMRPRPDRPPRRAPDRCRPIRRLSAPASAPIAATSACNWPTAGRRARSTTSRASPSRATSTALRVIDSRPEACRCCSAGIRRAPAPADRVTRSPTSIPSTNWTSRH